MKRFNPKDNGVQLPWLDDQFVAEWQIWLQYRKERRLAAYRPLGLKRTFEMLKSISNGDPKVAVAIINQSISNNWQGLFKLKQNEQINSRNFGSKPISEAQPNGGFGQL